MEQAARELSDQAEGRDVSLSVSGQASVVQGIYSLLYRAFFNLLVNSIKYNRPAGTVTVTLERNETAVCVSVKDTGIGIPTDALPHIFEPFYRADQSRSQQIPGSVLGLAVVKMILEHHGALLKVTSQEDICSLFTV